MMRNIYQNAIKTFPIEKSIRNLWLSSVQLTEKSQATSEQGTHENNKDNYSPHENDEEYVHSIKTKILDESLNFVHQYGWSKEAITAGAESINYPGVVHGLYPNGGMDLIQHFYSTCNTKLQEKMQKSMSESDPSVSKKKPILFVEYAVQKRLEMVIPYKQHWPQALAIMSRPSNITTSMSNMATLIDNICYFAGDRSVDMTWYARRIGLAGIYKTTELYMLQDSSENHQNTWNFLNRRINDASELNKISDSLINLPQPEQIVNQTISLTSAIFGTAQNILGLNWRK